MLDRKMKGALGKSFHEAINDIHVFKSSLERCVLDKVGIEDRQGKDLFTGPSDWPAFLQTRADSSFSSLCILDFSSLFSLSNTCTVL